MRFDLNTRQRVSIPSLSGLRVIATLSEKDRAHRGLQSPLYRVSESLKNPAAVALQAMRFQSPLYRVSESFWNGEKTNITIVSIPSLSGLRVIAQPGNGRLHKHVFQSPLYRVSESFYIASWIATEASVSIPSLSGLRVIFTALQTEGNGRVSIPSLSGLRVIDITREQVQALAKCQSPLYRVSESF